jgi:hypothetical protein
MVSTYAHSSKALAAARSADANSGLYGTGQQVENFGIFDDRMRWCGITYTLQ